MNDDNKKTDEKKEDEHEVLKTFDMYHFFSRVDVILAIIFILVVMGLIAFMMLPPPVPAA